MNVIVGSAKTLSLALANIEIITIALSQLSNPVCNTRKQVNVFVKIVSFYLLGSSIK